MYEKDARGGSRYIEIIKAHFGVTSPDSRLQRPEYLGGNRVSTNANFSGNASIPTSAYLTSHSLSTSTTGLVGNLSATSAIVTGKQIGRAHV